MEKKNYPNPWNFGIKPSDYVEHSDLTHLQEDAITEDGGIEFLDDVFNHTLKCPPPRNLNLPTRAAFRLMGDNNIAVLMAGYAKPGGSVDIICSKIKEKVLSKLYFKLGLKTWQRDSRIIEVGFDQTMLDINQETEQKREEGSISKDRADLIYGLLYGFPVGDVIEFINDKRIHKGRRVKPLLHGVQDSLWNPYWAKKVGLEGERRLAEVYRKVRKGKI